MSNHATAHHHPLRYTHRKSYIEELGYLEIFFHGGAGKLTEQNIWERKECCEQLLKRYCEEGVDFLFNIVSREVKFGCIIMTPK